MAGTLDLRAMGACVSNSATPHGTFRTMSTQGTRTQHCSGDEKKVTNGSQAEPQFLPLSAVVGPLPALPARDGLTRRRAGQVIGPPREVRDFELLIDKNVPHRHRNVFHREYGVGKVVHGGVSNSAVTVEYGAPAGKEARSTKSAQKVVHVHSISELRAGSLQVVEPIKQDSCPSVDKFDLPDKPLIAVCQSSSCMANGAEHTWAEFRAATADIEDLDVCKTGCINNCEAGPSVIVESGRMPLKPGEHMHIRESWMPTDGRIAKAWLGKLHPSVTTRSGVLDIIESATGVRPDVKTEQKGCDGLWGDSLDEAAQKPYHAPLDYSPWTIERVTMLSESNALFFLRSNTRLPPFFVEPTGIPYAWHVMLRAPEGAEGAESGGASPPEPVAESPDEDTPQHTPRSTRVPDRPYTPIDPKMYSVARENIVEPERPEPASPRSLAARYDTGSVCLHIKLYPPQGAGAPPSMTEWLRGQRAGATVLLSQPRLNFPLPPGGRFDDLTMLPGSKTPGGIHYGLPHLGQKIPGSWGGAVPWSESVLIVAGGTGLVVAAQILRFFARRPVRISVVYSCRADDAPIAGCLDRWVRERNARVAFSADPRRNRGTYSSKAIVCYTEDPPPGRAVPDRAGCTQECRGRVTPHVLAHALHGLPNPACVICGPQRMNDAVRAMFQRGKQAWAGPVFSRSGLDQCEPRVMQP